jgi:quercetin dioxygenase-like cupin family protein
MRTQASLILMALTLAVTSAFAQDFAARQELKRTDLNGQIEVISSIVEVKPGEEVPWHSHHGVESGYILQGTMVQSPGKDPVMLTTGTPVFNLRDVKHGGYKVVGDQSLKIYTVHVVDKGKPLYDTGK